MNGTLMCYLALVPDSLLPFVLHRVIGIWQHANPCRRAFFRALASRGGVSCIAALVLAAVVAACRPDDFGLTFAIALPLLWVVLLPMSYMLLHSLLLCMMGVTSRGWRRARRHAAAASAGLRGTGGASCAKDNATARHADSSGDCGGGGSGDGAPTHTSVSLQQHSPLASADGETLLNELEWVGDMLQWLCRFAALRTRTSLVHVGCACPRRRRRVLAMELASLTQRHRELWVQRCRREGLDDSVQWLAAPAAALGFPVQQQQPRRSDVASGSSTCGVQGDGVRGWIGCAIGSVCCCGWCCDPCLEGGD